MNRPILSFDPGGTTGFAILGYDKSDVWLIESGQIPDGLDGFIEWWIETEIDPTEFTLVCESFSLREGIHGVNLAPCYVIGALQALSIGEKVYYQSPTFKGFCDNEALRSLDMWIKGQQHARDAIRHAIAYLRTKERHIPTLKKGWPENS